MSFFINQILEIESLEYGKQTLNLNISDNTLSQLTELQNESLPNVVSPTSWSISTKIHEIINQFESTIFSVYTWVSDWTHLKKCDLGHLTG
ncbi:34961_t:CDS:2 [Gigaspora margarita]|uniref:34961_t:CDS:1 n=1 Tax=Gigaspora margarita TaxID=4874 RepID=A0ABN7UWB9_GIGMA|nr:34961_t:CDS:2 [Gigaspora margarita]